MDRVQKLYAVAEYCDDIGGGAPTTKVFADYQRAVEHFKAKIGELILDFYFGEDSNKCGSRKCDGIVELLQSKESCSYVGTFDGDGTVDVNQIPMTDKEFKAAGGYFEINFGMFCYNLTMIDYIA